jgi:hypothetical protein
LIKTLYQTSRTQKNKNKKDHKAEEKNLKTTNTNRFRHCIERKGKDLA